MSFRIFVTGSGLAEEARQLLKEQGGVYEAGRPADTPEDIAAKLEAFDPDGLIVRQGKITAQVLDAAPRLRVVCKHGVGTDNIDVEAAGRRGIPVLYTPMANCESVAEHALALILALLRRIPYEDGRVRKGVFEKQGYEGQELLGKTLGIIGFGRAGRRLAELIGPFGAAVLAFDPLCPEAPLASHVTRVSDLEQIYSRADIISLHCPLTPETRGMIRKSSIDRMKPGVYLINTARGGIVREDDLLEALKEGRIRGAALDVLETEPPGPGHPLFELDSVILTPHVGGMSDHSFKNMGLEAVRNVLAVLTGGTPSEGSLVIRKPES